MGVIYIETINFVATRLACDIVLVHDDVIKWKHFPRYWPFVRGIHRSPVNSPHKGQWRGALMYSLICVWINGWVNNREADDLRRYRAHYDVTVMGRQSDKIRETNCGKLPHVSGLRYIVYTIKYAFCSVLLQSHSCVLFTHLLQGCSGGTGASEITHEDVDKMNLL